jgi:undecaprenyl diphosphate synthase
MSAVPRHLAVIMDGNGRWAKARHLPRTAGHRQGLEATRRIIEACARAGVEVLTLFAFSSENWRRPKEEVSALMQLFISALGREVDRLVENGVRLRFIGEREAFGDDLVLRIGEAERRTRSQRGLQLVVAANYGGRWDLARAARDLASRAVRGELRPEEIGEAQVADALSLCGLPEPDLFIRTGGEQRISNFLLWDLAYTELYFTDTLWPDFDASCLQEAFTWFSARERRFGRTGEQVQAVADV